MNSGSVPLLQLLSNKMSWLTSRQAVLSQNIANADTPSYKARDIKPVDFAQLLADQSGIKTPTLVTTNARHIAINMNSGSGYDETQSLDAEGTPSGNAVSLEQEMIKLSDTQIQYQTATNIYAKAMNMFRTALGGR